MRMSNYPDGVQQSDVDRAAGGYEIPCECIITSCAKCSVLRLLLRQIDSCEFCGGSGEVVLVKDCPLHGDRRQRPEPAVVAPEGTDVEF